MITMSGRLSESSFVVTVSAASTSGRLGISGVPRSVSGGRWANRLAAEVSHDAPEHEQRQTPPEIDVDAQGALIDRRLHELGGQPVEQQQSAQTREQEADRQADVKVHG